MSWILAAGLVMIWAAFLLPSKRRSPASSVDEFERKMSLLAETNKGAPGRWVLMPRRGERFMGPLQRNRARARRRRRHIFVALLDATVLTLLMGLFPPFRVMLVATGAFVVLLLAYTAVLVQIRITQSAPAARRNDRPYGSVAGMSRMAVAGSQKGWGVGAIGANGHRRVGKGHRAAGAEVLSGSGRHHRGQSPPQADRSIPEVARPGLETRGADELFQLIDDDVHVIVRRAGDPNAQELASATR